MVENTRNLLLYVAAFHFLAIGVLFSKGESPNILPVEKKKLAITTVQLKPKAQAQPKPQPKRQSVPMQVAKQKPQPQAKAKPKPPAKVQVKQQPKKAPPPKKENNTIAQKLQQLQQSRTNRAKATQKSDLPELKQITSLNVDQKSPSSNQASYQERLVQQIQSRLKLPEKGSVKLSLSLNQKGNPLEVNILSYSSESNRRYVEQELKKMHFPPFDGDLKQKTQHTFSISVHATK